MILRSEVEKLTFENFPFLTLGIEHRFSYQTKVVTFTVLGSNVLIFYNISLAKVIKFQGKNFGPPVFEIVQLPIWTIWDDSLPIPRVSKYVVSDLFVCRRNF